MKYLDSNGITALTTAYNNLYAKKSDIVGTDSENDVQSLKFALKKSDDGNGYVNVPISFVSKAAATIVASLQWTSKSV